jgi:hypothetical protein
MTGGVNGVRLTVSCFKKRQCQWVANLSPPHRHAKLPLLAPVAYLQHVGSRR